MPSDISKSTVTPEIDAEESYDGLAVVKVLKNKMKNHSEAERRRRERINAHLQTLRGLLPTKEKMDKAALLGEVVRQVKQLKMTAKHSSECLNIPMDSDDVSVRILENNGSLFIRASICCEYGPDLLSSVRKAINNLSLAVLSCQISTLGGRLKIVFIITPIRDDKDETQLILTSLRTVLCDVIDKASAVAHYAHPLHKRQRLSYNH